MGALNWHRAYVQRQRHDISGCGCVRRLCNATRMDGRSAEGRVQHHHQHETDHQAAGGEVLVALAV